MTSASNKSHAGDETTNSTTARPPHWSDLTQACLQPTGESPSQELFGRAVAALLASRRISATQNAFEALHALAEQYLENLVAELARATRVQRRTAPGVADCLVLLRLTGLNASLLEDEREAEQRFPTTLPAAWTEIELSMLPTVEHDSSELFSTSSGSGATTSRKRKLVPSRKDRGKHIPDWMPEFPPDHTFMTTCSLPDRVTDPRALREMIVQEGQLAEHALRRLTGVIRVDENAATHDDDDDLANAETKTVTGNHANSTKSEILGSTPSKGQTGLEYSSAAEPVSLSAAVREEDNAPLTNISADTTTAQVKPTGTGTNGNHIAELDKTAVSASNISDNDPFNIKHYESTSKRFDVVEYARSKRRKLQHSLLTSVSTVNGGAGITTSKNSSISLRDNSSVGVRARAERFHWQRSLVTTNKFGSGTGAAIDTDTLDAIGREDRDPAGLGAAISLVEHEYNVALAMIQRSKDAEAKKESIVDTGIVNWERDRFLWA